MNRNAYFIVGDLLSNATVGLLAAMLCNSLIGPGWPMLVAMLVAMVLGMILAMLLATLVFSRFFGAMEVMVPTMLSGMFAGMVVGMIAAMTPLTMVNAGLLGLLIGLITIGLCAWANRQLRGPQGQLEGEHE